MQLSVPLIAERHSTKQNKIAFKKQISCRCIESSSISIRIFIANIRQSPYRIQKQPPQVFYKKGVFKTFVNFTGKNLCCSLFLIKFIKKRLQHSCFPVKFEKILRTPNLKNICERLFLRKLQEKLLNSTSRVLHFNECL